MKHIEKVHKKDIQNIINDNKIWHHEFLATSKNRLFSLSLNPDSDPDDLVLLLAYLNDELVGYLGIYINKININNPQKIGWLSTWWVHPKTKGTGIGLDLFNTMYEANNGRIGISQFTDSAKRVYDKSGYFTTLKYDDGLKSVLRSHLISFIPNRFPRTIKLSGLLNLTDNTLNSILDIRLNFKKRKLLKELEGVSIEYLTNIDNETMQIIQENSKNNISVFSKDFFNWFKAYKWLESASIVELTDRKKYEFSIYDKEFEISYLKINKDNKCIGFVVLQKRNFLQKVLFSFYNSSNSKIIADIIKLQLINENTREIICFDPHICKEFLTSNIFLFNTKKQKKSIISKEYLETNFNDCYMHYGDGDCCFV